MTRSAISITAVLAITTLTALPGLAQQAQLPEGFVPGLNFVVAWDGNGDGTVSLDEVRERHADVFTAFDANEDGLLSAEEFAELDAARTDAMQRPKGQTQGNGNRQQGMTLAVIDKNSDGKVSQEEHVGAAEAWFVAMDSNADGKVTKDDFGQGMRGQGQGMALGQQGRQDMGQGQQMSLAPDGGRQQGMRQGHGRDQHNGMHQRGGNGQVMQGQGRGHGGGQGKGHGMSGKSQKQGMGGERSGQKGQFQAFATDSGAFWIVDSRTGDVMLCQSHEDSSAPAGFAPVCVEADR